MTRLLVLLVSFVSFVLSAATASAQGWMQWGGNARHESAVAASGQRLDRIEAEVVIDPFVIPEKTLAGGNLLTHYPVPLVDGDDLFLILKGGSFSDFQHRSTQTWSVHALRRNGLDFASRWTFASDWKPVPTPGGGGPSWEAVYHPALTSDSVWAPGAGGTIDRINRADGTRIQRFNPFGSSVDSSIYMAGPPSVDDAGNIYYNAIQLDSSSPWSSDAHGAWLVKIAANGAMSKVAFSTIVTGAPAANAQCTSSFLSSQLPWPPSPNAIAPAITCGAQRPGINVAPAIGADGTIYTISRAHLNDRWGFLVAVNPNLTPKWTASLRNRLHDGCNVAIPPNGTPGGCRAGAATGVDPAENLPGSGRVSDNSTSSPVVTPDGRIVYGSYTRYNYSQGHLMSFDAGGSFVAAHGWGWDLTPAVYRHDGTYSLLLKENHYDAPPYCSDPVASCPRDRTFTTPFDPEQYFITQLDPSLHVEWRFRNSETKSCARVDNVVQCFDDHPAGFEWCVNAVAVDGRGVVYANGEDGNLYAIDQGGLLRERIFLNLALGAAYTPLSIGFDGRIYTQNDGKLFVVGAEVGPRRRTVR
jgi:outer membrane protein assembly factor BamB